MDRKKTALAHALSLLICSSTAGHTHSITMSSAKLDALSSNLTTKNTPIGSGYIANSRYPMHRCLKSMDVTLSDFQPAQPLKRIKDLDTLAKLLGEDMAAGIDWDKFAGHDLIHSLQDDDYSLHFTYVSTISMNASLEHAAHYAEDALNPMGIAAYHHGIHHFIELCGDAYVDNMRLGAALAVTLQINFKDPLQKKQFEASLHGELETLTEAYEALTRALDETHSSNSINISFRQQGGDALLLSSILDNQNDSPLDNVTAYVAATGQWEHNGFAKQIQLSNTQLHAKTLYPLQKSLAKLASYQDFGISIPQITPSPTTLTARKKLNDLYTQADADYSFASNIQHALPYSLLAVSAQRELETLSKTLKTNLDTLTFSGSGALKCFLTNAEEECPNVLNRIEAQLTSPDMTKLNLLHGAYYVNINERWPVLYVKDINNTMKIYDTNINPSIFQAHDLALEFNPNLRVITPHGGYSAYDASHKQTRYYMDFYGAETWLRQNASGLGYFGKVPWNTCVNGNCSKSYNTMYVLPF